MKYSFKLRINKQRIRPDGNAALFYQVIIDRKKTTVPLDLYWPAERFDETRSEILPRQRNDKMHEDYTRSIERKANDINEVFIWARLAQVELSTESFHRELANQNSRYDFIQYWQRQMDERFAKGKMKKDTKTVHASSLKTLSDYRPRLQFNEINKAFLDDYKAWLFNHENLSSNTVWKKLKDVRTYLNLAKEDKYSFEYPFKGFKMPKFVSRIAYLQEDEFLQLKEYFYAEDRDPGHETTLRAFLFACYTGLRISDLMAVTWKEVRKGVLAFKPVKGSRELTEVVRVPLHAEALRLIPTKKGVLIPTVVEQSMNRTIKNIAAKLDISQDISFHWARHTFATRFIRHGGRIEVLQQLLGHKKIETTMIYVHVDEALKRKEIDLIPA